MHNTSATTTTAAMVVRLTINISPNGEVVTGGHIEVRTSRETERVDSRIMSDGRDVLHTAAMVFGHCNGTSEFDDETFTTVLFKDVGGSHMVK